MPRHIIVPANTPPPLATYSPGVQAGGTVYVSGMLPIGTDGQVVAPGDVSGQTRHVIEAIKAVLVAAGGSLADVVHNAIFLQSMDDYAAMNRIYAEYFSDRPPARYCIRADLVKPEFLVEISTTAHL
jgi:aminoacrylate peracid reductase